MKYPPYKQRSRRELKRAVAWGLAQLNLQNWTYSLFLDDAVALNPQLNAEPLARARIWLSVSEQDCEIGVRRDAQQEANEDPIFALFHELGHLACWWDLIADREHKCWELWERTAELLAHLLWRLYPHK